MKMTRPDRPQGFSLIELMVVIGIIAVLIAIIVPAVGYGRRKAKEAAIKQAMQGIVLGLGTYHNDFNMYPPSSGGGNLGGNILAMAMLGYRDWDAGNAGDGAGPSNPQGTEPQYGFRLNKSGRGKVYGPYAPVKLFDEVSTSKTYRYMREKSEEGAGAILYYRANTSGSPTTLFGDASAVFNMDDNQPDTVGTVNLPPDTSIPAGYKFDDLKKNQLIAFRKKLGIMADPTTGVAHNIITAGSVVPTAATYLLISAGLDGLYFTGDDVVSEGK